MPTIVFGKGMGRRGERGKLDRCSAEEAKRGKLNLDLNATFQRRLTELQVMLEGVFEPVHPKGLGLPGVIAASPCHADAGINA